MYEERIFRPEKMTVARYFIILSNKLFYTRQGIDHYMKYEV